MGRMEPAASSPDTPGPPRRRLFPRPERGIGWAEGGRLTTRQRLVPALALVVLVGAAIYTVAPFTVADVVECKAALGGSEPEGEVPAGAIVGDARRACRDVGNSRLSLAGVVGLAALIIGAAGLFLPPDPDEEAPDAEEPDVAAPDVAAPDVAAPDVAAQRLPDPEDG
jgi:hypothetical protein